MPMNSGVCAILSSSWISSDNRIEFLGFWQNIISRIGVDWAVVERPTALKSFEFNHIPGLDRSGCTPWSALGIYSHEIACRKKSGKIRQNPAKSGKIGQLPDFAGFFTDAEFGLRRVPGKAGVVSIGS